MNARRVPDPPEGLTPGEAVAGMMLNGLGFAHRPWSLTPPCFARTPLALVWHDGVRAELCHRFTRGRTRDAASADGGDRLVHELARCVCARKGIDRRFNPRDTPSCSRSGEYLPASDEQAMTITHG